MELDKRFSNAYLEPGNFWGNHYNAIFYNTPKEFLPEIKQKLDGTKNLENNVTSCLIEINQKEIEDLERAIARLKTCVTIDSPYEQEYPDYLVYSTYICMQVAKTLLENDQIDLGNNEEPQYYLKIIDGALKVLKSDDRAGSPVLNICLQSSPTFETLLVFCDLKKEELNFLINGKIPPMLQKQINQLISRRDMHIKLWTTESNLASNKLYSGMTLQPTHDYIYFDFKDYIKEDSQPNK